MHYRGSGDFIFLPSHSWEKGVNPWQNRASGNLKWCQRLKYWSKKRPSSSILDRWSLSSGHNENSKMPQWLWRSHSWKSEGTGERTPSAHRGGNMGGWGGYALVHSGSHVYQDACCGSAKWDWPQMAEMPFTASHSVCEGNILLPPSPSSMLT